jgi:hypothetical protein
MLKSLHHSSSNACGQALTTSVEHKREGLFFKRMNRRWHLKTSWLGLIRAGTDKSESTHARRLHQKTLVWPLFCLPRAPNQKRLALGTLFVSNPCTRQAIRVSRQLYPWRPQSDRSSAASASSPSRPCCAPSRCISSASLPLHVCVCSCVVCVCVCVLACMRVYVRACVCACVRVRLREGWCEHRYYENMYNRVLSLT